MRNTTFAHHNNGFRLWMAALLIACMTFLIYLPALHNGFVNWDDDSYVYNNKNIRIVGFAFFSWSLSAEVASLWHPLTLFSLALDYASWALNPFGYHLTNISLHALNTFLVFILAVRLTRQGINKNEYKTSLIVGCVTSLLFGLHPLHVESVAWISERKDVLSAFFYLLTILIYVRYVSRNSKKPIYYFYSLFFFIMALMSKPMAVTLPIVLLVLDLYPFNRLTRGKELKWVFIEKLPFFISSVAASLLTLWATSIGGAARKLEAIPFLERIFVAANSYIFYLAKMVFPFNLAPLYPYPVKIDPFAFRYSGAIVLLIIITFLCLTQFKRNKLFISVWSYYIVSLTPVIGIVQVGAQAAADRYTYLPSIGPFILLGLLLNTVLRMYSKKYQLGIVALVILLTAILVCKTEGQIVVWRDSITLWSRETRLFPDALHIPYLNRGEAYFYTGNYQEAIKDFNRAIDLNPFDVKAYSNRGAAYVGLGNYQEAIKDFSKAISMSPLKELKDIYYNRGVTYYSLGNYQEAIRDFNKVISLSSRDVDAYYKLGQIYSELDNINEALANYRKAAALGSREAEKKLRARF